MLNESFKPATLVVRAKRALEATLACSLYSLVILCHLKWFVLPAFNEHDTSRALRSFFGQVSKLSILEMPPDNSSLAEHFSQGQLPSVCLNACFPLRWTTLWKRRVQCGLEVNIVHVNVSMYALNHQHFFPNTNVELLVLVPKAGLAHYPLPLL